MLTRAAGVPMPEDSVFDAVERLHAELEEVRELLTGPDATVRLVLTPETVVVAEARRSLTTLSLFGYRVDGVIANRVFPAEGADDWRAGWVMAQEAVLDRGRAVVRGPADLALGVPPGRAGRASTRSPTLAETAYDGDDPLAAPDRARGRCRSPAAARGAVLRIALPFVASGPTSTSPATATSWS